MRCARCRRALTGRPVELTAPDGTVMHLGAKCARTLVLGGKRQKRRPRVAEVQQRADTSTVDWVEELTGAAA